jgi:hypothetical protein
VVTVRPAGRTADVHASIVGMNPCGSIVLQATGYKTRRRDIRALLFSERWSSSPYFEAARIASPGRVLKIYSLIRRRLPPACEGCVWRVPGFVMTARSTFQLEQLTTSA